MKKTLLLILSTLSIVSASQSGSEIFKKCGICHGDKGQKHSLNITKFIAGMKEDQLIDILKAYRAKTRDEYGLGTMMQSQAAKLTDEEIKVVSAYISTLPPIDIKDINESKQSKATLDGVEIFKKCSICHGDEGHKRSLGVSRYIAGMDKDDVIEILKAYRTGKLNSYGYGSMMQGQATKLSEKEMEIVSAYVSSLPAIEIHEEKPKKVVKKITKEEKQRNDFIRDFFANSKNPNETLKAAEEAYKEYLNKQKEK